VAYRVAGKVNSARKLYLFQTGLHRDILSRRRLEGCSR
jgi:hypothetical protein